MIINPPARNRGAALAAALILLVSLTLIAVTMAYRSTMDELMAANQRDALNAMSIADSGLEAGYAVVKANYRNLPQALCDIADSGNYLIEDSVYGGPVRISGGSYAVTVRNCVASDKAVLRSVGEVNGAERMVETLLEMVPGGGGSRHTVLTDAFLDISNSQKFVGPIISVHSNTGIKDGGAPMTCSSFDVCGTEADPPTGHMSTSGTFDPKTWDLLNQSFPWELHEGVPEEAIPHVYPPDWWPYATVELTADCKVYSGPATGSRHLIWDVAASGVFNGWSCSIGNIWEMKVSNGSLYDGFYYVRGNIKISASHTDVWNATFVAEGSIAVTCCMKFAPWGQTGDETADVISMLAGNDVQFTGTPGFVHNGIIAAHMEIKLAGSQAYFKGSIVAENGKYYNGQEVTTNTQAIKNLTSLNSITADVVLEGTGIGLGGGSEVLRVAAWRELVH